MLWTAVAASLVLASPPMPLELHGPPALVAGLQRVGLGDRFAEELRGLTGRQGREDPVHVVLVPEGAPTARAAPSWVAGYALPEAATVVLFPARAGAYPRNGVDALLRHELAHVVIARAVAYRPLPRWLSEGLAMTASREQRLADQGRILLAALAHPPSDLDQLDAELAGPPARIGAAYALAAAFTSELLARQEPEFSALWLQEIAGGEDAGLAYLRLSGEELAEAERRFFGRWKRLRWLPLITSSAVLWLVITGLALAAGVERRHRAAAKLATWREEELLSEPPPSPTVH